MISKSLLMSGHERRPEHSSMLTGSPTGWPSHSRKKVRSVLTVTTEVVCSRFRTSRSPRFATVISTAFCWRRNRGRWSWRWTVWRPKKQQQSQALPLTQLHRLTLAAYPKVSFRIVWFLFEKKHPCLSAHDVRATYDVILPFWRHNNVQITLF